MRWLAELPETCSGELGFTMNAVSDKSCWGVARWAVAAFLTAVALVYLFGGFETVTLASS
ncbi:MAG: hypothetical protein ACAH27_09785 [Xanthobacteraceae bacterium]